MKFKLLLSIIFVLCTAASLPAQDKNCQKIEVKIEVIREGAQPVLSIDIQEKGDIKIRLIDSKGKVSLIKDRKVANLAKGEYDIIIIDESNLNRCPFSKRIKI